MPFLNIYRDYSNVSTEIFNMSFKNIIDEHILIVFAYISFIILPIILYTFIDQCFMVKNNDDNQNLEDTNEPTEEDIDESINENTDDNATSEEDINEIDEDDTIEEDSTSDTSEEDIRENKENYPELYRFFQFQLTKKKLLKIVGSKFKNINKKDLVKIALEKFKNETINNSLENYKYFSSNFRSYLKSNRKLYQSELIKLFNEIS